MWSRIAEVRSKLRTVVDEDDVESSQRRSMTLVVELKQRFQHVTQVDRRANHSWSRLLMTGWFKVIEAREKVTEEEESFWRRTHGDVDVQERWSERLP